MSTHCGPRFDSARRAGIESVMSDRIKIVVALKSDESSVLSDQTFDSDDIVLGRMPTSDVVLPDPEKTVSSRHARIERRRGRFRIFDQGSANGTFVNGKRVSPNHATDLKDGDVVTIGKFRLGVAILADETNALAGIQASVEALSPDDTRALLDWLLLRAAPSANVLPAASDVSAAARKGLSEMSSRFLGPGAFQSPAEVERFLELVTQMIEFCLKWLAKSLEARAEFQAEHSIDLTKLEDRVLNPITKAREPREIGLLLLDWRSPRDLALIHNILDDTFRDLVAHQVGLMTAVEESVQAVLRRLDPKAIEREALQKAGGGLSGVMAALSITKRAWDRYTEYYAEFLKDPNRLLNEVISPNVKKGYRSAQPHPTKGDTRPPVPPA